MSGLNALKFAVVLALAPLLCNCFVFSQATARKAGAATGVKPQWVSWSDDVFKRAKVENRFVLLDLEAVWCHWCHVMDENT